MKYSRVEIRVYLDNDERISRLEVIDDCNGSRSGRLSDCKLVKALSPRMFEQKDSKAAEIFLVLKHSEAI